MPRSAKFLLLPALGLALAASQISCNESKESAENATSTTTIAGTAAGEPVQVVAVDLGRAIGNDKQVTERLETFRPSDTIYASIHTSGNNPSSKLGVKWTYQDGQVVDQSEQMIVPVEGANAMEFHLAKPAGLPAGNYKVEVFVNGNPVQSREFRVTSS